MRVGGSLGLSQAPWGPPQLAQDRGSTPCGPSHHFFFGSVLGSRPLDLTALEDPVASPRASPLLTMAHSSGVCHVVLDCRTMRCGALLVGPTDVEVCWAHWCVFQAEHARRTPVTCLGSSPSCGWVPGCLVEVWCVHGLSESLCCSIGVRVAVGGVCVFLEGWRAGACWADLPSYAAQCLSHPPKGSPLPSLGP